MTIWKRGVNTWNGLLVKSPILENTFATHLQARSVKLDATMSSFPPHRSLSSKPANAQFDWSSLFTADNKVKATKFLIRDKERIDMSHMERTAAVLVPLCYDIHKRPSLLYNLRSHTLSKHKGEISFPGGGMDPEDENDPVKCALRETQEELGIPKSSVEIWTTLRPFPTVSTNLGVIPVLGFIDGLLDPSNLQINPAEVDHAFTIPIEFLCNSTNWEDLQPPGKRFEGFKMPTYTNLQVVSKISGEVVNLWGLTAYITHLTLVALVPAAYYGRHVQNIPVHVRKELQHDHTKGKRKPEDSSKL